MKQPSFISNNGELSYDARNIAAFLYRIKNEFPINYNSILSAIQLVAPFFDDFVLNPMNEESIQLRWRQRGVEDVFGVNQLSDGTLRFICLACLILQPEKLRPETMIIDEPELGLHPFAISLLAELIYSISDRTQVIISTQSIELLDQFEYSDIIIVDRKDESSVFRRVSENEVAVWINEEYSLGDIWKKNIIGGRPK
jgi:predicted ATPase